jgi:hypothetical protein
MARHNASKAKTLDPKNAMYEAIIEHLRYSTYRNPLKLLEMKRYLGIVYEPALMDGLESGIQFMLKQYLAHHREYPELGSAPVTRVWTMVVFNDLLNRFPDEFLRFLDNDDLIERDLVNRARQSAIAQSREHEMARRSRLAKSVQESQFA